LWNEWNALLPSLFFEGARAILTDTGYLALLYADNFDHISVVHDALQFGRDF
jgi:hypothetical protein